jgi:small subunit ribosomal protein S11
MPETRSRPRRRERRTVARGKAFIQSTFNNTLITITDMNGNTLCWASSGSAGFKGSRKGTPYAAQVAAETVARKAADFGMGQVESP